MKSILFKIAFFILLFIGFGLLAHSGNLAVLNPKGAVAFKERQLMITATLLMLIVVIPVFILLFSFMWRYRASNTKAKYTPNVEHNNLEEFIWWAIPIAIIAVLATITWVSTHELDPYKPIISSVPPITVDVVALDWKWLFIYPDQHIATVNYLEIPENTPINFKVTADAPMNSFWIPSLSGQVYAMPGMVTQLHVIADGTGDYTGVSSNFSGDGFSKMNFAVHSTSLADFAAWVGSQQQASSTLDWAAYQALAKPSENTDAKYSSYSAVGKDLYTEIVMKYMLPTSTEMTSPMPGMPGM